MTIQSINPNDSSLESIRTSSAATERTAQKTTGQKPGEEVRKDGADVSELSRTMTELSEGLQKDLQVRPDKVHLARTKLEQGFDITDQNIDAIWDRMIQNI